MREKKVETVRGDTERGDRESRGDRSGRREGETVKGESRDKRKREAR